MPIFKNGKRVEEIHYKGEDIRAVYLGTKRVWSKEKTFGTCSWAEIAAMINDGTWTKQGWEVGDEHTLRLKNGNKMSVRIIGINDGREQEKDFIFQVDKDENDNNVHLTLELTSCIDNRVLFSTYQEKEQLEYSNSDLFAAYQPNGDIYELLPNDFKPLIIPAKKKCSITASSTSSEPSESIHYLFPLSVQEYAGVDALNYEINKKEGLVYEYYNRHPDFVPKKLFGTEQNIYYWTRSASQIKGNVYEYFWAIGSQNNHAMYPADTELAVTFGVCI